MDAVLALRLLPQLQTLSASFRKPLVYIDFKAVFHSVDRAAVWKPLEVNGVSSFLLQLMRNLHHGTTSSAWEVIPLSHSQQPHALVEVQSCTVAILLLYRLDCASQRPRNVDKRRVIRGSGVGRRCHLYGTTRLLVVDTISKFSEEANVMRRHMSWRQTNKAIYRMSDPALLRRRSRFRA